MAGPKSDHIPRDRKLHPTSVQSHRPPKTSHQSRTAQISADWSPKYLPDKHICTSKRQEGLEPIHLQMLIARKIVRNTESTINFVESDLATAAESCFRKPSFPLDTLDNCSWLRMSAPMMPTDERRHMPPATTKCECTKIHSRVLVVKRGLQLHTCGI